MSPRPLLRAAGTAAAATLATAAVLQAAFVNPVTPSFQGGPLAEQAGWESFTSAFGGSNAPDDPNTTPAADFALVQTAFGGILSGGDIYNASQASTFEITHVPDPAIANPDLRTVVLQVRTYGTELDLSTVKLRHADESGGTVGLAPDSYVELWRAPFGGLGEEVEHLFQWDLDALPTVVGDYLLRFKSEGAHMALDTVLLDAQWASLATSYCSAGTSASGCTATISASGSPSASEGAGFVLAVDDLEGAKDGIFFLGANGRQAAPWGNGSSFQCVVPPVKRAGLIPGVGTGGQCDGQASQDLNALWCPSCPKAGLFGAGTVVQAQFWYRDPQNTSNQSTSLSDAIEFTLAP